MPTLNLTQHQSTHEQGCVDLQGKDMSVLKGLLTFETLPTRQEILYRAAAIANLAAAATAAMIGDTPTMPRAAMIGGAPFLMGPLEAALKARGITPLYAFSERVSEDAVQPDGSVRKVAVFRHKGFIEA